MLDQVLLRPGLSDYLKDVKILESDGQHSLLDKNEVPSAKHLSDHLPVLTVLSI